MNVLGCEVVDVQIPAPDDGVRTFFTLDRNIAQPIFGVKPGDKILIARKPKP